MCQNQKTIFDKINDQLDLVVSLALDLKQDLTQKPKIKKADVFLADLLEQVETILTLIPHMDLAEDLDGISETSFDDEFDKMTYGQIIDISQQQESELDQNLWPKSSQFKEEQLESDLNKGYALKRGPYRSYAIEEKQTVIKLYKNGKSYAFISRVLGIPQKNIVRWCKNGVYRKEGAGRKIGDSEMERFVIQWITESYTEGSLIKSKKIREKALEFSTKTEFKSSKGWMKNFIRRYGLNERYLII